MVGMMLLKSIHNLSNEGVVARWLENPYMQYFTGGKVFRKCSPINPVDMTKFRKRAGIEPVIGHLKIAIKREQRELAHSAEREQFI